MISKLFQVSIFSIKIHLCLIQSIFDTRTIFWDAYQNAQIGRIDIVENRYVGMKSRGCYETPGGTIMLKGHRAIESITLDREVAHLKDELMPRYASILYNGYWWSPERRLIQTLIDESQMTVTEESLLNSIKET